MKNAPLENKISDFAEVITGGTPSTARKDYWKNGNIPWLASGELKNCKIYKSEKFVTKLGLENSVAKIMPRKTVLIALTGATTGQTGLLEFEASANQSVTGILPSDKHVPEYLFYFLRSQRTRILGLRYGAAQPHISQGFVKEIKVPLPPLEIQRKIASILQKTESAREKSKEGVRLADEFIKSVFLNMFGDPVENSDNKLLSESCELNPKNNLSILEDKEVSFIPMSAVSVNGKIDLCETRKYKDVKSGFTSFLEGDVLFAKITPCMENGKGAIARKLKNGIGFGSTEFHVIRPGNKAVSEWIYCLLSFKHIRELAARNMTGTAGQKRVPVSFLKNLRISVPTMPRQYKFADIVQKVEKLKEKQRESEKELDNLFNSLMQRAFKGDLFKEDT